MSVSGEWRGPQVQAAANAAKAQALHLAAGALKDKSNAVAPIEEGILIGSSGISVDGAGGEASVYYDTVYAARQHEELTWRHDPGRQAKYLEEPLHANAEALQKVMANAMKRALGG